MRLGLHPNAIRTSSDLFDDEASSSDKALSDSLSDEGGPRIGRSAKSRDLKEKIRRKKTAVFAEEKSQLTTQRTLPRQEQTFAEKCENV